MRTHCDGIRPLLALTAGGELSPGDQERVAAHLAGCRACQQQVDELSAVIEISRSVLMVECQLPLAMRERIISQAAARAGRSFWSLRLPVLTLVQRPVLVAVAALLVVLASLPIAFRSSMVPDRHAEVTSLDVVSEGGLVRIAWSDGSKDSYTVYKSSDPRAFRKGEAHVVRGNVWTDPNPDTSGVIFYQIE